MSVNNFKQIKGLLEFRSDDDFYFVQVLQRKKDFKDGQKVNGTNNNSRLIKAYYIKSLEQYDFLEKEIIELCNVFNARAGINLNRRSFQKMSLQHLKKITDQIINGDYQKAYKAYSSVVGTFSNETDKKWILDVDGIEKTESNYIETLKNTINNTQPKGEKILSFIPSKSGYHLITKPFNLLHFNKTYPDIEVHKNNPTNLYII